MRDIKDQYNYKPHDIAKTQLEYFLNRGMSFHAIVNTALDRMYREESKMDKLTHFQEMHPGYIPDDELELHKYRVVCKPMSSALQEVTKLLEESEPIGFDDDGNEIVEIATRHDIEQMLNQSDGVVSYSGIA